MRKGKLAESALNRSVLRQLHTGADSWQRYRGADCAVLGGAGCAVPGSLTLFTTVNEVPGCEDDPGSLIVAAANGLAAGGAQPEAFLVSAMLPVDYEEPQLRADIQRLAAVAERVCVHDVDTLRAGGNAHTAESEDALHVSEKEHAMDAVDTLRAGGNAHTAESADALHVSEEKYAMDAVDASCAGGNMSTAGDADASDSGSSVHTPPSRILGGHTQVSDAVTRPVYSVTGIGRANPGTCRVEVRLQPGDALIVTEAIALAGTAALAARHEEALLSRYPFSLVDRAKQFGALASVGETARAITHFGTAAVHDLSQGGMFNALWEMAERADVGLEVDLKKIPIRQETVEICEYFDINPYYLYSAGSLLVGTAQGEALVSYLAAQGIRATVIGSVTADRARLIRNGEDIRYLDRPQPDEWYRTQR